MEITRECVALSLNKKLISWIEENRGLVSRSRFVEKMILDGMKKKND